MIYEDEKLKTFLRQSNILVKATCTFNGKDFICKLPKGFENVDNGKTVMIGYDTLEELLNDIKK